MDNLAAALKEFAPGTLLALDLIGTFVFALSGAIAGVRQRLDIFGVLVLSFTASSVGGIMRDVLIGSVPPAAIGDWRYLIAALLAGLLVFIWFPRYLQLAKVQRLILIFDAAGLALFAVTGTQKALGYGLSPIMAPLLGMLSGIGGGMLRDVLVAEIPNVLRSDLYAVAALVGAVVVVIGDQLGILPSVAAIVGAAICFCLRLLAIHRGWQLPRAHPEPDKD